MDWQQLISLIIVAAAALWLIRTQILAPRRGGCGSCPGSVPRPDQKAGGTSQLVQIDLDLGGRQKKPGG
jgi:hypothetical protein